MFARFKLDWYTCPLELIYRFGDWAIVCNEPVPIVRPVIEALPNWIVLLVIADAA